MDVVPQETLGAPLKPRLDASGAASATAGSAPVFSKAALPVFLVEHRSFFSAPATDFYWSSRSFFCSSIPIILGGTIMSFQKKRITFECDEATHMKIQSLLGNKTYLNTKDYQNLFQSIINRTYENFKGKQFK